MGNYLVTGINSGLGKYLFNNLDCGMVLGLDRNNFDQIKDYDYDAVIHCAFNKSLKVEDHYRYLEDNIFLTQKLLQLKYKKFIYISTIDVYSSLPNIYGLFKIFSESMIKQRPGAVILRCSMMLGKDSKPNHITKLMDNVDEIGLSGESTFNYITYQDIARFVRSYSYSCPEGTYDFVANSTIKISDAKTMIVSDTKLGNYIYQSPDSYLNPIYNLYEEFNNSSEDNLNRYLDEN